MENEWVEEKKVSKRNVDHGNNVKRMRRLYGWSQEELGKQSKTSQQSVSKWEGEREIPADILEKFANGFKVPVAVLRDMEEDEPCVYDIHDNKFDNESNLIGNDQYVHNTYNPVQDLMKLFDQYATLYKDLVKRAEEKATEAEKKVHTHEEEIRVLGKRLETIENILLDKYNSSNK